jgi:hypothetical protein
MQNTKIILTYMTIVVTFRYTMLLREDHTRLVHETRQVL